MFSNLARRAFVALAIMQSAAAFVPMPMKNVQSSSALNARFEVVVCTDCDGAKGSRRNISLTLFEGNKPSNHVGVSGDHWQGSVDKDTSLDFGDIEEPTKFSIRKDKKDDKWQFQSIYPTNI